MPLIRLPGPLVPASRPRGSATLAVRFMARCRSRAAARSPGSSRPRRGGVRRWVPAPPPRRAPHQQMVLRPPHPRGCGAPTDRTWPASALPPSALRPAWPVRRGNRGGPRRPRAEVWARYVSRRQQTACRSSELARGAAADGEDVRFGWTFLEDPGIVGSCHRSPARCHDLAPRAGNRSRLHFCSAPILVGPGGSDGPSTGASSVPSNRAVLSAPNADVSTAGTAAAASLLSLPLVGHRWARRQAGKRRPAARFPVSRIPAVPNGPRAKTGPVLRAGRTERPRPGSGVLAAPSPATPVGASGAQPPRASPSVTGPGAVWS